MHDKWELAGRLRHQAAVGTRFLSGGSSLVNSHSQAGEKKINVFDPERQLVENLAGRHRPI
jgi:hypothetical protein